MNADRLKTPNGKPSNLTAQQWVKVRTPEFKKLFGDWETLQKKELLEGMSAISIDDSTLTALELITLRTGVKDIFTSFQPVKTQDGRTVLFTPRGYKEVKSHSANPKMLLLLAKADTILKKALPLFSEVHKQKDKTDSIRAWHYYGAKVFLTENNKKVNYYARIVVREDVNGNIYYDNDLTKTEKINGTEGAHPTNSGTSTPAVDRYSIAHFFESVNPSEVSKAVDENGEPLVTTNANGESVFVNSITGQEIPADSTSVWA